MSVIWGHTCTSRKVLEIYNVWALLLCRYISVPIIFDNFWGEEWIPGAPLYMYGDLYHIGKYLVQQIFLQCKGSYTSKCFWYTVTDKY
jgi:hypothetical protein